MNDLHTGQPPSQQNIPFIFTAIGSYLTPFIDGRVLHQLLELDCDYLPWIKVRLDEYSICLEEGEDYYLVLSNKPGLSEEYHLTIEAAMSLAGLEPDANGGKVLELFVFFKTMVFPKLLDEIHQQIISDRRTVH